MFRKAICICFITSYCITKCFTKSAIVTLIQWKVVLTSQKYDEETAWAVRAIGWLYYVIMKRLSFNIDLTCLCFIEIRHYNTLLRLLVLDLHPATNYTG